MCVSGKSVDVKTNITNHIDSDSTGKSGEVQPKHEIEDMRKYYKDAGNSSMCSKSYNNYYIISPDSVKIITFPAFKELNNISKHLPNWKAADIDGIFNFFIKYILSVYK
ncbi:hypothetical protein TCON_0568 [Astathelohania contejeani]|uniref:Uncharacterized protein n=1 Tax=Astathelohania contejeani TaxID=164912 RepID=A0ABQ7I1G4_9MICR|nr:hypothetical protein TCON_0568 [Thelohania contejeani]